jgi:hypothetical protein
MRPHADGVLALRVRADQAIVPQKPTAELLRATWTSEQPTARECGKPLPPLPRRV